MVVKSMKVQLILAFTVMSLSIQYHRIYNLYNEKKISLLQNHGTTAQMSNFTNYSAMLEGQRVNDIASQFC